MSIDTVGSATSGVTSYPVVIQLDPSTDKMYPHMSATATIIIKTKSNVLLVPVSAVQTQNDESLVRVLKQGKVTQKMVTVGDASDTQIIITSGLSEGEAVVTSVITQSSTDTQSQQSPFSPFGIGGARTGGGAGRTSEGGGTVRFNRGN